MILDQLKLSEPDNIILAKKVNKINLLGKWKIFWKCITCTDLDYMNNQNDIPADANSNYLIINEECFEVEEFLFMFGLLLVINSKITWILSSETCISIIRNY